MTPEQYADSIIPNPSKHDAPFCTTADRWEDIKDAFLKGRESANKWISVSERMPEESCRCLCYCRELTDLGFSHFIWNCCYNKEDNSFTDGLEKYQVTHWLPLPSKPEKI